MTTNFYHCDGTREYDRDNTGGFDDFDQEELTDDDLERIAAEIEAVNLAEGASHPDRAKARWEGLPQAQDGEAGYVW